ncbi:hypothetical protein A2634_01030 [Candidatus Amesbacteria bacterium RIFCSPHIGHO2_01_FULL_48_32]|uniref:Uncharacterized protein n=1 Tax=Candidatus Amesbacteria bacterium RIFCSPLOWO2_01_FULL_48_25 TaxID=1797259 RepID=A0A1F4ZBI0_9BACT|nr:MAG: hypothetical protein A2634_01030 [Candidatus Amesbacteria bacterium RIFCSPHIGHO2_01_FULL_48_32]OGD03623.1 MAG: hypothetical protein A2989_03010 [Candidatus Amesbacteria bacterium RIFCSPLOWO2_01_FULL_48_25]HJZ06030.1 hypothetical protein [Patescibacteria group bacterium]
MERFLIRFESVLIPYIIPIRMVQINRTAKKQIFSKIEIASYFALETIRVTTIALLGIINQEPLQAAFFYSALGTVTEFVASNLVVDRTFPKPPPPQP